MNYQIALSSVEKPNFDKTTIYAEGLTNDIMQEVLNTFDLYKTDTKEFSKYFAGGNARQQAGRVWEFLRKNIRYVEDPDGVQDIKRPSIVIYEKQADCKGLTILANSILYNLGITCFFEFARYKDNQPKPTHVYSKILDEKGNVFYLDACLSEFGIRKQPKYFIVMPTQINRISGLPGIGWGFFEDIGNSISNVVSNIGNNVNDLVSNIDPTTAGTAGNQYYNSIIKPVAPIILSSVGVPPQVTSGLLDAIIPNETGLQPIKVTPQILPPNQQITTLAQNAGMTVEQYQAYLKEQANKDNKNETTKKSSNTPLLLVSALGLYFMSNRKK